MLYQHDGECPPIYSQENFKDAPQSIGEIRAEKEHRAGAQSPRDTLVSMLRQIDKGEINPEMLIVCYREMSSEGFPCTFYEAGGGKGDYHIAMGLLEGVKGLLNKDR